MTVSQNLKTSVAGKMVLGFVNCSEGDYYSWFCNRWRSGLAKPCRSPTPLRNYSVSVTGNLSSGKNFMRKLLGKCRPQLPFSRTLTRLPLARHGQPVTNEFAMPTCSWH